MSGIQMPLGLVRSLLVWPVAATGPARGVGRDGAVRPVLCSSCSP